MGGGRGGGREKKKRERGVTVDKFWNVSKNNFSYGVVKTMLNVHKI